VSALRRDRFQCSESNEGGGEMGQDPTNTLFTHPAKGATGGGKNEKKQGGIGRKDARGFSQGLQL